MSTFVADYIAYVQESRIKSEGLHYYQMNQYFWKNIDNSHWREKRDNFYRNHSLVLHQLAPDADKVWLKQLKNFIARDNLLYYLPKVDDAWIDANVNTLGFDAVKNSLVRSTPVVYLTFHNFYQVLIPLLLAQHFGPVYPFVLDEDAEGDHLTRVYLSELYKGMEQSLNGGRLLKVGAQKSESSKLKMREVLAQKGSIYAAIDMVHPLLGGKTKVALKTKYFEIEILTGVVREGLLADSQFAFPFVSLTDDGTLRMEMFRLDGVTVEEILESYQKIFDMLIARDVSVWEGASLLTYNNGKFS